MLQAATCANRLMSFVKHWGEQFFSMGGWPCTLALLLHRLLNKELSGHYLAVTHPLIMSAMNGMKQHFFTNQNSPYWEYNNKTLHH